MSTDTITPEMPVANDEILYRAVMNEARFFPSDGQGGHRISTIAFNDIGRRPSVDRAALCPNGQVTHKIVSVPGAAFSRLSPMKYAKLPQHTVRQDRYILWMWNLFPFPTIRHTRRYSGVRRSIRIKSLTASSRH